MARYLTVRVVDSGGRPKKGARVGLYVHRTLASGFKPNVYTDAEGKVEFALDDDSPITLYVDGREMHPKGRRPEACIQLIV
jgi:hypothetical protein